MVTRWLTMFLLTQRNLNMELQLVTQRTPSSLTLWTYETTCRSRGVWLTHTSMAIHTAVTPTQSCKWLKGGSIFISWWQRSKETGWQVAPSHQVLVGGSWWCQRQQCCSGCRVHGVGRTRKVINVSHRYSQFEPTHRNISCWLMLVSCWLWVSRRAGRMWGPGHFK